MILLFTLISGGLWQHAELWRSDGASLEIQLDQRLDAQRLFSELLAGAAAQELPADLDARAASLNLQVLYAPGQVVLHGDGGVFAVTLGHPELPPLVLQAPHAWYDYKTGRICSDLFDAGAVRALFLNAGQRYGGGESQAPGFDLAHTPISLYQSATLGAAQGLLNPLVVQIHGYGPKTSHHAAVVSRGAALEPLSLQERAVLDLGRLFANLGSVGVGEDTPLLAAHSNSQAQVLSGRARFLHIELGKQARRDLASDPELQAAFGQLLLDWTQ